MQMLLNECHISVNFTFKGSEIKAATSAKGPSS